jgi:phosphomannomutase
VIAFVGGSDLTKIKEQLGDSCVSDFDFAFSQNGLLAMKGLDVIGENVSLWSSRSNP